jgi:perosamine synthetase
VEGIKATKDNLTRRGFIRTATAGSAALVWAGQSMATSRATTTDKPALLGGTSIHQSGWSSWPRWSESWESDIVEVLSSGRWSSAGGGGPVAEFEAAYAKLLGADRCVATASGSTALITG